VETNRSQQDPIAGRLFAATEQQDRAVVEAVQRIAGERGIPRAQVALAWVLTKPAITAPIVGATKPEHLADAIAALDLRLSDAEVAALEAPYVPHAVTGLVPPLSADPPALSVVEN
jgi:aryl-alcohol dehydrogenase-like predicted oxidoreductase